MLDRITTGNVTILFPTGAHTETAQAIEYAATHGLMVRADVDEMDGLVMSAADARAYDEDRAPGEPLIVTALMTPEEHEAEEAAPRRTAPRAKPARLTPTVRDAAARALIAALTEFNARFGSRGPGIGDAARHLSCEAADALAGLLLALGDVEGRAYLLNDHATGGVGPCALHSDRPRGRPRREAGASRPRRIPQDRPEP